MADGKDFWDIAFYAIDNSIVPDKNLTNIWAVKFAYDTAA